jgi:hypothetical protein
MVRQLQKPSTEISMSQTKPKKKGTRSTSTRKMGMAAAVIGVDVTIVLSSLTGLGKDDQDVLLRWYRVQRSTKDLAKDLGVKQTLAVRKVRKAEINLQRAVARKTKATGTAKKNHLGGKSEWTEAKDERRCGLIDREIAGVLSAEEQVELVELQEQMLEYRRKVAPLPLRQAQLLHRQLLSQLGGQ